MPHQHTVLGFSYIRFSSKKQAKGDSERRQKDNRAPAYCKRRGWTFSKQTYEDLGVSAFKGKNALVGNLGEFLKAVRSGRVPAGSALIVESFDRITRQGIDEGWDLIKGILKSGILIVTLAPEREYDESATRSLSKGALEIMMVLERAAEESERKSERVAEARAEERKRIREKGEVVTRRLPAWIREKDGKPALIPEAAAAVRHVFTLAASGYGVPSIVAKLRQDEVPPIGRTGRWNRSYIGLLLSDRRAVGEYQPYRGKAKDGLPVPNYFPAAVTQDEWLSARAGMAQRKRFAGRRGRHGVNVFAGLMKHAREGDSYIMTRRISRSPFKETTRFSVLVNANSDDGLSRAYSIPYEPFEEAVLSLLREVNPDEVLEQPDRPTDPVADLEKKLEGVAAELADASAFMSAHGFSTTIGKRVAELEGLQEALERQLTEARHEAKHPLRDTWDDTLTLAAAVRDAEDPDDARMRLRTALRRITQEISLLVVPRGMLRVCAVQFHFREGKRRDFLILYRQASKPGGKPKPSAWRAGSLANVAKAGELDLRKPKHARALEALLSSLDPHALWDALDRRLADLEGDAVGR
jgi:DNA invertase Pin-like site-specific DNA recombinase